jgi:Zn-finger nucleic acid-binding protein
MPCPKCGALLINLQESDVICPKCNGIHLLDRHEAIVSLTNDLKALEITFRTILASRSEKNKTLIQLAIQREQFSRDFFTKYQAFDLTGFLALNLLIYRIMKEPYFNAKKPNVQYASEIAEATKAFKALIRIKADLLLLREGLSRKL